MFSQGDVVLPQSSRSKYNKDSAKLYKQFKPLVTQVVLKNDEDKNMYKSLVNFCSLPQK